MIITITQYRIVWSNKGSQYGAIDIGDNRGNAFRLKSTDPALLLFWVDLLRNEQPVYFNDRSEVLYTGPEPLGEGET